MNFQDIESLYVSTVLSTNIFFMSSQQATLSSTKLLLKIIAFSIFANDDFSGVFGT